MSVRGRASLLARQQLDAYFLPIAGPIEVTLTGDSGGSRAVDTPVTSPEGSDKGGKLPRQLNLAPPRRGIFMLSSAMPTQNPTSRLHVSSVACRRCRRPSLGVVSLRVRR